MLNLIEDILARSLFYHKISYQLVLPNTLKRNNEIYITFFISYHSSRQVKADINHLKTSFAVSS